jgi:uncharacterized protein YjiS (DUF1127 family)
MMDSKRTRFRSAAALFWLARATRALSAVMHMAAREWHIYLERRRVASVALDDFRSMNERELLDIGLTRVDVNRVAWGASDRCV